MSPARSQRVPGRPDEASVEAADGLALRAQQLLTVVDLSHPQVCRLEVVDREAGVVMHLLRDRIQLLMELERRTGTALSESQFASARTIGDLTRVQPALSEEPIDFPEWNRSKSARWLRRAALPFLILPLARIFAWVNHVR